MSQLKTLQGHYCDVQTIVKKHQLQKDMILFSAESSLQVKFQTLSSELSRYEPFWIKELSSLEPTCLPFLPTNMGDSKELVLKSTFDFSKKWAAQLNAQFLQTDVCIELTILALFYFYFHRLRQQEKISVGLTTPLLLEKINGLASFIAPSIPLTLTVDESQTFQSFVLFVKEKYSQLQENPSYLLDVYARYPHVRGLYKDVPMVFLIGENAEIKPLINAHQLIFHIQSMSVSLYSSIKEEACRDDFNYVMTNLFEQLDVLLETLLKNPQAQLADISLPLLSKEKQKITGEWNQRTLTTENQKSLYGLFEAQARKTPERIALVFNHKELTYQELYARTEAWAGYLQAEGVHQVNLFLFALNVALKQLSEY